MAAYRIISKPGDSFWATRSRVDRTLKEHRLHARWAGAILVTDDPKVSMILALEDEEFRQVDATRTRQEDENSR